MRVGSALFTYLFERRQFMRIICIPPRWNPLGNDVHTDVCVSRDLTATEGLIIPDRGHLDRRIPGVVHNSFVVLQVEIMLLRRRRSV